MGIDDAFDVDEGFDEIENIRNTFRTINSESGNKPNCWYDGKPIYKSSFDKTHNCTYCLVEDTECLYSGGSFRLNTLCAYKGGYKEKK